MVTVGNRDLHLLQFSGWTSIIILAQCFNVWRWRSLRLYCLIRKLKRLNAMADYLVWRLQVNSLWWSTIFIEPVNFQRLARFFAPLEFQFHLLKNQVEEKAEADWTKRSALHAVRKGDHNMSFLCEGLQYVSPTGFNTSIWWCITLDHYEKKWHGFWEKESLLCWMKTPG